MITDAWKAAIGLPPDYGIFYNINNRVCCFFTIENRISPRMPSSSASQGLFSQNLLGCVHRVTLVSKPKANAAPF